MCRFVNHALRIALVSPLFFLRPTLIASVLRIKSSHRSSFSVFPLVIMSTAKRDIYWDIIKGVAIFLVVLGHSLQYFYIDSAYSNTDFLFSFIYSFHMPLFMVVSGYFAYSSFSKPIYEGFKKSLFR